MLKFESSWRFNTPGEIQLKVSNDFSDVIAKIARGQQDVIEHFKSYFASAAGSTSSWSSSASWADTDLHGYMEEAAVNAPLFIEAFFDACEALKKDREDLPVPDINYINNILVKNQTNYKIELPNTLQQINHAPMVSPEIPLSLDEKAQQMIQKSFNDAKQLLSEGRDRQAVQEVLWLLETVSTAFQGIESCEGTIEGKYFNKIVEEMRRHNQGKALEQIIGWITKLHGYLSAPSGGGIRHGMNLKEGLASSPGEARLYCNLITSYISFFLSEYERLKRQ